MIEAIIKMEIVISDSRRAKIVRFLGIPVFVRRELDVREKDKEPKLFEE